MGPDIPVVPPPDPAPHPPHEPGEHVEPQVEGPHGRDLAVGRRVQHVEPRVGQVARRPLRLLDERDDPALLVQLGDPARPRVGRPEEHHGHRVVVPAVEGQQGPQVDIAEVVGVDDDDLFGVVGQVGVGGHRAGRAQQLRLVRLRQAEPAIGVDRPDILPDPAGVGVGVDPRLPDPGLGQALDPVIQQGPIPDRHQAFRDRVGQRAESRPQPAREYQGLGPRAHRRISRPRPVGRLNYGRR